MPHIDILLDEMSQLRIVSDKKVDHPRKGSKDLSDAVTGAVYNAIAHTPRNMNQEIEVYDWKGITKKNEQEAFDNVITAPPPMTKDIAEYLDSFGML
jgi:protoporphyrinogen oxidase